MPQTLNSLLLVLAMVGLVLPNANARGHAGRCDSPAPCLAVDSADCTDLLACHHCPPPEDCPCEHGEDSHRDEPSPPGSDPDAPAPSHEHHHHHQCVCATASTGLIYDSHSLSLHPPRGGHALAVHEQLSPPESPVFLLERPPAR